MIDYDQHLMENRPLVGRRPYWDFDAERMVATVPHLPSYLLALEEIRSRTVPMDVAYNADSRRRWNTQHGIEEAVIFPTVSLHLHATAPLGGLEELDYCQAYNRTYAGEWDGNGLVFVRMLPGSPHTARIAVEADPGANTWLLSVNPQVPYSALEAWGPTWEAMGSATLALHQQYGSLPRLGATPLQMNRIFERETQDAAISLIARGTLDLLPLNLLVAEAGSGWWDDLLRTADENRAFCGIERDAVRRALDSGSLMIANTAGRTEAPFVPMTDCPHRIMRAPAEVEVGDGESIEASRNDG